MVPPDRGFFFDADAGASRAPVRHRRRHARPPRNDVTDRGARLPISGQVLCVRFHSSRQARSRRALQNVSGGIKDGSRVSGGQWVVAEATLDHPETAMPNRPTYPTPTVLARATNAVLATLTAIGLLSVTVAAFTTPLSDGLAAFTAARLACDRGTDRYAACGDAARAHERTAVAAAR
jgi:hypothetical protein